jgi:hypothetical protein
VAETKTKTEPDRYGEGDYQRWIEYPETATLSEIREMAELCLAYLLKEKATSQAVSVLVWVRVNAKGGYTAIGEGLAGDMDYDHMGRGEAEGKFNGGWSMKLLGEDSESPDHLVCIVADVPLPPPTPFVTGQRKLFE